MVSTRSSTKDKKLVVSKRISNYFTKLVEPLVTTQRVEEMFGKRKDEIIERFEEKLTAQNQKTVDFRGGSGTAATSKMEHFVIIVNGWKPLTIITKHSTLDVAAVLYPPLDLYNEQYSRRYRLRMHGLKYDKNENQSDIVSKISECFSEIGLPYEVTEIDKVHRIGKPYENESSSLTMKPIIIKIKSWRYRQDVYRNQPRRFENRQKKLVENSFSFSLVLTKRRYNLLKIV